MIKKIIINKVQVSSVCSSGDFLLGTRAAPGVLILRTGAHPGRGGDDVNSTIIRGHGGIWSRKYFLPAAGYCSDQTSELHVSRLNERGYSKC